MDAAPAMVELARRLQTRVRIRAAFDRLSLDYRRGEWYELPISVKLASGVKSGWLVRPIIRH